MRFSSPDACHFVNTYPMRCRLSCVCVVLLFSLFDSMHNRCFSLSVLGFYYRCTPSLLNEFQWNSLYFQEYAWQGRWRLCLTNMTDIFIIATPWGNLNVLPICHDWTIHYCQVFNKTSYQFKNTCREKE